MNYHEQFFIIHSEGFTYRPGEGVIAEPGREYVSYQWVIPVYVYTIGTWWHGEETFHCGPVDFSRSENKDMSWRFMREYRESDIGKILFRTEADAWRELYSNNNEEAWRRIYAKRELHFVVDNRITLNHPKREELEK